MRIIVAGAGRIGYSVASELSKERHDITVIERSAEVCAEVSDTLDVFTVNGNAAACDIFGGSGRRLGGSSDCRYRGRRD